MDAHLHSVISEVEEHSKSLPRDAQAYWIEHKRRYSRLAELLDGLYTRADDRPRPRRILDVGPSYQTLILARMFPDAELVTLGIEDARYKPREDTRHLKYDLNDAYFRDSWPRDEGYDLILMLEVIEHLATAPWRVLALLRSLTNEEGRVVVSTPNALFLRNRLVLLRGENPFEMLQDTRHRHGLGHFREYTRDELIAAARRAHLRTVHSEINNVLLSREAPGQRLYDLATRLLPESFRQMITMVFGRGAGRDEPLDPQQVVFELGEGWFPLEWEAGNPADRWRWTGREASVFFDNPQRRLMLYLQVAGAEGSAGRQTLAVAVGGETIGHLPVPTDGDAIHKISIEESALGTAARVEIRFTLDRTFTPASEEENDDSRELGVRVLRTALVVH